jgi:hypothetical protein
MKSKYKDHADLVDAWAKRMTLSLSREQIVRLFEQTTAGLWNRSHTTISTVLLTAVWERVLFNGSVKHAPLSLLKLTETGINFDELYNSVGTLSEKQLVDALQLAITEFIAILGSITNEIITPFLYLELSEVKPEPKKPMSPNGEET